MSDKAIFSDLLTFPFSADSLSSHSTQKSVLFDKQSDTKRQYDIHKTASSMSELENAAKYFNRNRELSAQDEFVQELLRTEFMKEIITQLATRKLSDGAEDVKLREKLEQQQILIDNLTKKLSEVMLDLNSYRSRTVVPQKMDDDHFSRILVSFLNNPEFLKKQEGLKYWLESSFMAKNELDKRFSYLTEDSNIRFEKLLKSNSDFLMDQIVQRLNLELKQKYQTVNVIQDQYTVRTTLSDEKIERIVNNILKIYDADKTGLVDYAMEPMGGQVITTRCTESYSGTAVISILGLPLWYPSSSPRTAISPGINPGKCWAFQNFPGLLVIKLMSPIHIESFSLEHISKLLVPEGKIDSAPKDFEVFGLRDEEDRNGEKLGEYRYDSNGEPLQFFKAVKSDVIFEYIELKITSNHGNPNYTCLYRFRVHGRVHNES